MQGEEWGEGIIREFGMDVYTLLYLTWRTSKDLLGSTGDSAQCHVAAWLGGEFGGEWVHMYGQLSPPAVHLKPSQDCSVAESCPTFCNPVDCSTPGLLAQAILQYKVKC